MRNSPEDKINELYDNFNFVLTQTEDRRRIIKDCIHTLCNELINQCDKLDIEPTKVLPYNEKVYWMKVKEQIETL